MHDYTMKIQKKISIQIHLKYSLCRMAHSSCSWPVDVLFIKQQSRLIEIIIRLTSSSTFICDFSVWSVKHAALTLIDEGMSQHFLLQNNKDRTLRVQEEVVSISWPLFIDMLCNTTLAGEEERYEKRNQRMTVWDHRRRENTRGSLGETFRGGASSEFFTLKGNISSGLSPSAVQNHSFDFTLLGN